MWWAERWPVEGGCRVDPESGMEGTLKDHVVLEGDGDEIVMERSNTAIGRELGDGNETMWHQEWKDVGLGGSGWDVVEGKSGCSGRFEASGVWKGNKDRCGMASGVGGESRGNEVHGAA